MTTGATQAYYQQANDLMLHLVSFALRWDFAWRRTQQHMAAQHESEASDKMGKGVYFGVFFFLFLCVGGGQRVKILFNKSQ